MSKFIMATQSNGACGNYQSMHAYTINFLSVLLFTQYHAQALYMLYIQAFHPDYAFR